MSLSARRILRPSCHISVLPRPHSVVITEPTHRGEDAEAAEPNVTQTSPPEYALINGTEQALDQYVTFYLFFIMVSRYVMLVAI